jgi:hypothetical protein
MAIPQHPGGRSQTRFHAVVVVISRQRSMARRQNVKLPANSKHPPSYAVNASLSWAIAYYSTCPFKRCSPYPPHTPTRFLLRAAPPLSWRPVPPGGSLRAAVWASFFSHSYSA